MSVTELKELDCWIAEHILKSAIVSRVSPRRYEVRYKLDKFPSGVGCGGFKSIQDGWEYLWNQIDHPTTDPAAAMKVLERCYLDLSILSCKTHSGYQFWLPNQFQSSVEAPTIELAICLLAKKLFTK